MTMMEMDVIGPVVDALRDTHGQVREEVVVTLDGQRVSIDAMVIDAGRVVVLEAKRSLTPELIDQCERWMGLAHRIYAVVAEPKSQSSQHKARRHSLVTRGLGLIYVRPDGIWLEVIPAAWQYGVDPRILLSAYAAHGEDGPPAGSSSARRRTPERTKWDPFTEYVEANPGAWYRELRELAREIGADWWPTSRQVTRAIDRGEWVGVRYDSGVPIGFWPRV